MTSEFSWQKLLAFALLHFLLQGQTRMLLQGSLDFLLDFQSPMMKKTFFFGVTSRSSYRFLYNCSTSAFLALVIGA